MKKFVAAILVALALHSEAPAQNLYGDRCVDPIWFQKPCDGVPTQLGTKGAPADCSAHTLTVGEPTTSDHKVYAIIDQCADLPAPCGTYAKPEDGAGSEAIRIWTQCYTGTPFERRQIRPSCVGRTAPSGRQTLRMWTLATIPFPGPLPEAQRQQALRAYGCSTTTTVTPTTPTRTPVRTAVRTPSRTPTRAPSECCPPTVICPKGSVPCVVSTPRPTPRPDPAPPTNTPSMHPSPRPTDLGPLATATPVPTVPPTVVPPTVVPPTVVPPTVVPVTKAPTPKPWSILPTGCP